MADKMSIDKADPTHNQNSNHLNGLNGHCREETDSPAGSSPDRDHNPAITSANATQEAQQPKRKGGRKPVSESTLACHLTYTLYRLEAWPRMSTRSTTHRWQRASLDLTKSALNTMTFPALACDFTSTKTQTPNT